MNTKIQDMDKNDKYLFRKPIDQQMNVSSLNYGLLTNILRLILKAISINYQIMDILLQNYDEEKED